MKTYSLHILVMIFYLGAISIITLAPLIIVLPGVFTILFYDILNPTWIIILIWLFFLVLLWFMFLNMPYKIVITGDQVYFKSFISHRILMFYELKSIRNLSLGRSFGNFISVSYMGGSFILINGFSKFKEFLSIVESENPRVIITGL